MTVNLSEGITETQDPPIVVDPAKKRWLRVGAFFYIADNINVSFFKGKNNKKKNLTKFMMCIYMI